MKYQDLHELGSESKCKAEGKYIQKGKDYVVEDGDILHIKFNVTNKKKWIFIEIFLSLYKSSIKNFKLKFYW